MEQSFLKKSPPKKNINQNTFISSTNLIYKRKMTDVGFSDQRTPNNHKIRDLEDNVSCIDPISSQKLIINNNYDNEVDQNNEIDDIKTESPIKNSKTKNFLSCSSSTSSSYFESSSSEEKQNTNKNNHDNNDQTNGKQNEPLYKFSSLSQLFPDNNQNLETENMAIKNTEDLSRQEFGGTVVYDSYARMKGNQKLASYYESNPVKPIDFNILFSKEEVETVSEELFDMEPKERDFATDFDKFLYKHLPKFSQQRNYDQPQYTINVPAQDNILAFDSKFECGNLRRAMKVNNVEYNLWLENDFNTKGHIQWFYFKVSYNYPKKQKIQFNILNFMKPQSLYQLGMKPCILSKKLNKEQNKGWFRGGEDISYTKNNIERKSAISGTASTVQNNSNNQFLYNNNGSGEGIEYYSTLSFTYEFEFEEDEVFFAYAIPYTYTDLQKYLRDKCQKSQPIMRKNILCKSLSGTPCPVVTITNNATSYLDYYEELRIQQKVPNLLRKQLKQVYQKTRKLFKQSLDTRGKVKKLLIAACEEEINSFYEANEEQLKQVDKSFENLNKRLSNYLINHSLKKAIVISSRVHPGEAQSSHMLQGVIDYLVSDEAYELRQHYVFRIIPMLNVDGVIYGNYRCSLLGVDLNRRWNQPNKFLHPTVYYSKQLIKSLHSERKVILYCDMHGHSRKQNAFFYGCSYKNFEHEGRIKNAQVRLIPLLCCHKNPIFSFKDCRFKIEKSKENTARVVVFKEFNIMNSFTLESSFFSTEQSSVNSQNVNQTNQNLGQQISLVSYMGLGQQLIKVLFNYLPQEQDKLNVLSGKVLEIFYEEFIKFIPPYMLRREEERKKQQQEQEYNKQYQNMGKSPIKIGLQSQQLNGSSSYKKGKRTLLDSSVKKNNRRKTVVSNKKDVNATYDDIAIHNDTDVENFTQVTQAYPTQNILSDLNEMQQFLLDIQAKLKIQQIESMKDDSDSSGSETSIKKVFSKQQNTGKIRPKEKKATKVNKKPLIVKKQDIAPPVENNSKISVSPKQFTTKEETKANTSQPTGKSKNKQTYQLQQQLQLKRFMQFDINGRVLDQSNNELRNQPARNSVLMGRDKAQIESEQYEKITHKASSQSDSSNCDSYAEMIITNKKSKSNSKANISRNKKNMFPNQTSNSNLNEQNLKQEGIFFKSYDENNNNSSRPIIPLYENPTYHQSRLQNGGKFKVQDLVFASTMKQSPTANRFDPYDSNSKRQEEAAVSNSNKKPSIRDQYMLYKQEQQNIVSNEDSGKDFLEELEKAVSQEQNNSFQRIRFKEMLETSRQNRFPSSQEGSQYQAQPEKKDSTKLVNQNNILQMLKSTYQKFSLISKQMSNLVDDEINQTKSQSQEGQPQFKASTDQQDARMDEFKLVPQATKSSNQILMSYQKDKPLNQTLNHFNQLTQKLQESQQSSIRDRSKLLSNFSTQQQNQSPQRYHQQKQLNHFQMANYQRTQTSMPQEREKSQNQQSRNAYADNFSVKDKKLSSSNSNLIYGGGGEITSYHNLNSSQITQSNISMDQLINALKNSKQQQHQVNEQQSLPLHFQGHGGSLKQKASPMLAQSSNSAQKAIIATTIPISSQQQKKSLSAARRPTINQDRQSNVRKLNIQASKQY